MSAWTRVPVMDCIMTIIIASGHSDVTALPPYPIVCWVSNENKKAVGKSVTESTHGLCPGGRLAVSKSP